jgi:PAS domain S-box-containing protein
MKLGIKRKMLSALAGVLIFTVGLIALLASYYTQRQNEEAAFADIHKDLKAWQTDLGTSTLQFRRAALALAGDQGVLDQLAGVLIAEIQGSARGTSGEQTGINRTLAYTKTVSLNGLYFMLRTGAFSSITVYSGGQLSHYVSSSEAGMFVRSEKNPAVWLKTPIGPDGNLPLESWPAWAKSQPPPELPQSIPEVRQPKIIMAFPAADAAAIDIAVPIEGVVQKFPTWWAGQVAEHLVSDLAVAGTSLTDTSNTRRAPPTPLAVIVFRKRLDDAVLRDLAGKTGKWPALFSPDGQHRRELTGFPLIPADLLRNAQANSRQARPQVEHGTVHTTHGSFYAAVLPWRFENQPQLILGFALSRDKTLENVRQTVMAILIVSGIILLLSMGIGTYWVGRFTEPILALTAGVNRITGPAHLPGSDRQALAPLEPIQLRAPDEIGALARAFNTMLAELRRSFETLEQRVLTRTAELRQQTLYLRTLLDTLPLWVCLKDTQGRYLAVNEPMAKLCGLTSADEMVGKYDTDIFPSERAASVRAEDTEAMTAKRRMTIEERMPFGPYDEPPWVERFRAPVLDDDGTALGIVHVIRDISGQKAAESARETALAEAMKLARLRSEFLTHMSHELRTPLNAILGYAQILQRDEQLSSRQARGLAIVQSSGEHLLNLINDTLDLARIDAGRLDLAPSAVKLGTFLQALADIIRVKAREKSLVFSYEAEGLPEALLIDAKRLRQVLLNLLSNAVKFTDVGEVSLRVRRLPSRPEDHGTGIVRLHFEIRDSGIGMSAEQVARIFQRFEQVADVDRREGGAGLGLAISQQLVHLMGGEIWVESQPAQGSRFSFELALPLATEAPLAMPSEIRATGYEGRRRSVLVVDDLPANVAVLMEMLTPLGFEVYHAGDGEEALAELETRKSDLIIMDIIMPRLDGLAATRRIRSAPAFAGVPIIAASASAAPEEVARSYEAGVNAFLAKPIEYGALLQIIGEQLELNWIYEERATAAEQAQADVIAPSAEEMDLLYGLALEGNMRSIRLRAEHLSSLDVRYRPFATQLKRLAESYQSKAILSFVETHRQQADANAS